MFRMIFQTLFLGILWGSPSLYAMGSKSPSKKKASSSESSSNSATANSSSPSASPQGLKKPKVGDRFQYQLDGALKNYNVDVVFLDLFDTSPATIRNLKGQKKAVICYFSAGTAENWRPDYARIPSSALGNKVDGWAGERWMNIKNSTVLSIVKGRIDKAKDNGCDGVDPDNVDIYDNNSGLGISSNDVKSFLKNMASYAHSKGIYFGLKNGSDIASYMARYADYAVVEQCYQYGELRKF